MYGKIFDSMYEGTLYGHWEAIVTLQQMLVLCGSDGVIDMTPQAISARTSIPLDIIAKGILVLAEPDPYSRTPGEEGRRIVLMDAHRPWGWVIVNYAKYRDLKNRAEKREADRIRMEEKRKSQKINDVADSRKESHPVADVAHASADAEANTDAKRNPARGALPPLNPRPDWLPTEWDDFEQHRSEGKKGTWTELARRKVLGQLERWRAEGYDLAAILNAAIAGGWRGLFARNEFKKRSASASRAAVEAFKRRGHATG